MSQTKSSEPGPIMDDISPSVETCSIWFGFLITNSGEKWCCPIVLKTKLPSVSEFKTSIMVKHKSSNMISDDHPELVYEPEP